MRKALCILMALLLMLSVTPNVYSSNTVYISTAEQLVALSNRVANGDSMAGIDIYLLSDIVIETAFAPIGVDAGSPFSGNFYGQNHKIIGLCINGGSYQGLFGYVYCGSIDGVIIEDGAVSGENYVALLVGRMYSYMGTSKISNCQVSGTVNGECYTGGLTGYIGSAAYACYAKAEIDCCSVNGTVKGDIYVGGIAGKADARSTSSRAEVIVKDCCSYGKVYALGSYGSLCGGIAGAIAAESNGGSSYSCLTDNVAYCDVSAEKTAAGGVAGAIGANGCGATAVIQKAIVFGQVDSAALAGGLSGKSESESEGTVEVKNSIAAGNVSGGSINAFSAGEGVCCCKNALDKSVSFPEDVTVPRYETGDANNDGACDNIDASLLLRFDAGLIILGSSALSACDMNGNFECDNIDASLILRVDAGL